MAIKIDLIDGGSARRCYERSGQISVEFVRVAVVYGLEVDSGEDLFLAAIQALIDSPLCGDLGSVHPNRDFCYLKEFQLDSISTDIVKVRIHYRDANLTTTVEEVGSSVTQVETNKDKNGDLITVQYTPPGGSVKTQTGPVQKFIPQTTAIYHRTEMGSPLSKSLQYVGKLNSDVWNGGPPGSWMCTGIRGRSDDGGITYDVEYSFEYRADFLIDSGDENGWNPTIAYIDPETGRPPGDIGAEGLVVPEIYDYETFATLGLL